MRDEENEHRCSLGKGLLTSSLEIELPFVYELFGNRVKVVMIMVGVLEVEGGLCGVGERERCDV